MKSRYTKLAVPAIALFALGLYSSLALTDRATGFSGFVALPVALAVAAAVMAFASSRLARGSARLSNKKDTLSAALFALSGALAAAGGIASATTAPALATGAAKAFALASAAFSLLAALWYILTASALFRGSALRGGLLSGAPVVWCCLRALARFVEQPVNKFDVVSLAGLLSPLALAPALLCLARAASLGENQEYLKKLPKSALAGVYLVFALASPYAPTARTSSAAMLLISDALCALALFKAAAPIKEQGEKPDE